MSKWCFIPWSDIYSILMFHPDAKPVSDCQPDALAHNIYIIVYAVKLIDAVPKWIPVVRTTVRMSSKHIGLHLNTTFPPDGKRTRSAITRSSGSLMDHLKTKTRHSFTSIALIIKVD